MYGQITDPAKITKDAVCIVYRKRDHGSLYCVGLFFGSKELAVLRHHAQNPNFIVMPYVGVAQAAA